MEELYLPQEVKYILEKLHDNGYEANVVGGGVRDFLLGRKSDDYDITTNALPEETKAVFYGERIIETGIKHGTVTLLLDGVNYEITTYRLDGEYLDSRHPEKVEFTRELRFDTSRRDFTINAICYNPYDGFSDFHGGIRDLKDGLIRTVGDPVRRFSEDALRIMRAIRFSAVLGFRIDSDTESAIFALSHKLLNISHERIFAEWRKMLSGKFLYHTLLKYEKVLKVIIPELSLENLPPEERFVNASPFLRSICLFKNAELYEEAMHRLHADTKTLKLGIEVLSNLSRKTDSRVQILLLLKDLGEEAARLIIDAKILLGLSGEQDKSLLLEILSQNPVYKISELKINGSDLLALGFRGKEIGELLEKALLGVILCETENQKEKLISFVNKNTKAE